MKTRTGRSKVLAWLETPLAALLCAALVTACTAPSPTSQGRTERKVAGLLRDSSPHAGRTALSRRLELAAPRKLVELAAPRSGTSGQKDANPRDQDITLDLALLTGRFADATVQGTVRSAPDPAPRAKLTMPAPAPDARVSVYSDGRRTHLLVERNGDRRRVRSFPVTKLSPIFSKFVVLSPDNRTILYPISPKVGKDEMQLWRMDVSGRHRRKLVDIKREFWVAMPVWSPDSRRIAYVRSAPPGRNPGLELWVMDADGGHDHRLLSSPAFNASIFYGTDPRPLSWTAYGDLQFKDYAHHRIWTVDGRTGRLSYKDSDIQAPEVGIPVIRSSVAEIPVLSQNDPRWRYDKMSVCGLSIGDSGCAITATSMSFSSAGYPATPRDLSEDIGGYACPLVWSYAASHYTHHELSLFGGWGFHWWMLDQPLSRGRPALVWLSNPSSGYLTHWVLVVGGRGTSYGDYRIYDPYDGTTYKTLAYYTAVGYKPMRVYWFGPTPPKPRGHQKHQQ